MIRGPRVERVDRPADSLLALTLRIDDAHPVLLLSVVAKATGAALAGARPRGGAIDALGKKLRAELEGLHAEGLALERDRIVLRAMGGGEVRLVVLGRVRGVVYAALYDGSGARLAAHGPVPELGDLPPLPPLDCEALRAKGDALVRAIADATLESRRSAAMTGAKRAIAKLERRLLAIGSDAARVDDVAGIRADATGLLAIASSLPRGARSARILDVTRDPPVEREIDLDPSRSPREQVEALFHRARRLERGAALAREREAATRQERDAILAIVGELGSATDAATIERLVGSLAARGVARETVTREPGRAGKPAPRLPFRRYVSKTGVAIWVGRTAEDNDALTLEHARPHHLFFHARGVPGSHVIVPLAKKATCDPETRLDAATLAAHFSNARGEPVLEVQTAERRHVRKPRGSAPGSVAVDREKVIVLRIEGDRLRRLLATEGHEGAIEGGRRSPN